MNEIYYLDDLRVGQRFGSGVHVLDEKAIKRFAAEYDPQPFHLNTDQGPIALPKLLRGAR
jgi:acyl dehydratase